MPPASNSNVQTSESAGFQPPPLRTLPSAPGPGFVGQPVGPPPTGAQTLPGFEPGSGVELAAQNPFADSSATPIVQAAASTPREPQSKLKKTSIRKPQANSSAFDVKTILLVVIGLVLVVGIVIAVIEFTG